MPVSGSGVMLGVMKVPNGVASARPPARSAPSFASSVWQETQPASCRTYSPRAGSPALAISGAAPRQGTSSQAASATSTITAEAISQRMRPPGRLGRVSGRRRA